jgi:hypothetical protein
MCSVQTGENSWWGDTSLWWLCVIQDQKQYLSLKAFQLICHLAKLLGLLMARGLWELRGKVNHGALGLSTVPTDRAVSFISLQTEYFVSCLYIILNK